VGGVNGLAFRLLGVVDTIAAFQADAESNWIRVHEPEVWNRIAHYLLLSGWLARRLTGRFVDSAAAQVGYVPFDFRRSRWAARSDWKWEVCGIDPAWLPELVQPGERLGELTAEAAGTLGLPAGLPVVATAGDKACEVLGSGALEPAVGALSLGTTATFNTMHRRYVEPIRYVPAYPAAVPGAWTLEIIVHRGFWMIEWFLREFGHPEAARATIEGRPAEALLDELIAQAPAGSMGLIVQPYWSPGLRFPGPEAKGAIVGFGDVHTRAHVYRAILEGIAYALRDGAERTERRTGTAITELRVSGGGARSGRSSADRRVFGLPTVVPRTRRRGLGAAIVGAVAGLIRTSPPPSGRWPGSRRPSSPTRRRTPTRPTVPRLPPDVRTPAPAYRRSARSQATRRPGPARNRASACGAGPVGRSARGAGWPVHRGRPAVDGGGCADYREWSQSLPHRRGYPPGRTPARVGTSTGVPRRPADPSSAVRTQGQLARASHLERAVIVAVVVAATILGGLVVLGDRLPGRRHRRGVETPLRCRRARCARPPDVGHDDPRRPTAHGTWRREYPSSAAADSFDLWSADRFAFYDADLRSTGVETDPGRPAPTFPRGATRTAPIRSASATSASRLATPTGSAARNTTSGSTAPPCSCSARPARSPGSPTSTRS
jgi:hypothetical protein